MKKKLKITTIYASSTTRMGASQAASLMQDGFTECFDDIKRDNIALNEYYNAFWVITKSKIIIEKAPSWLDVVTYDAYPINNKIIRTNVNCQVYDSEGNVVMRGIEELCVLDRDTHKPKKLSDIDFPVEGFGECILEPQFEKFIVTSTQPCASYEQKIYSEHIDMSGHLNNVEYVKLAMNNFSVEFLHSHEIHEIEMHYLLECKEGDVLTVNLYKEDEKVYYCKIIKQDRLVFEMKMMYH